MTDSTREHPDGPDDAPAPPRLTPRAASLLGAASWSAATLALAARAWTHASGNLLMFALAECWFIGVGCLGTPILILAALGNRLTATRCRIASGTLFGSAGIFTAIAGAGQMHPDATTATFALILLLAPAIHLYNAARALDNEARAYARGYRNGRTDGLLDVLAAQREQAAHLTEIDDMSLEEIAKARALLGAEIKTRRARMLGAPHKLHAVPDPPCPRGLDPNMWRNQSG